MNLTSDHIVFLERHKIPLWRVLNAEGMNFKEYQKILNNSEFLVAFNSNSKKICNNGHKLKFRESHGRCLECRVSNFSFNKPVVGFVYVAGSLKGNIIKVGSTENIKNRIIKLNQNHYGGFNDWELLYKGKYSNSIEVEAYIHKKLKDFYEKIDYDKFGKDIRCYETFQCSFSEARHIIDDINDNIYPVSEETFLPLAGIKYNFDCNISNDKIKSKFKLKNSIRDFL